jgi:hypothetical protein
MRAAALALLALALSGCLATPGPAPAGAVQPAALPPLPVGVEAFTQLVCGGALQALSGDHREGCNWAVTGVNGPAAEVSVAVNPRDPRNLVGGAKDFTLGEDPRCGKYNVWSGAYASFDGGRVWSSGLLPGHPNDTRRTALSDYACGSDPVLAFAPDGTLYYASIHTTEDLNASETMPTPPQLGPILGSPTLNAALAVTRSRDGGITWDDPVLLGTRDDGGIFDKEWLAIDAATGQLYVTHFYTGDGTIRIQRSDDHGQTWTEPVDVVTPRDFPDGPNTVQFGQVGVGPGSVVHYIAWVQGWSPPFSGIYHLRSTDGGATWSAPQLVAAYAPVLDLGVTHKYRIVTMPSLAVDPASGALYVAWPMLTEPRAAPRAQADLDIFVARSADEGASWGAPVRVNDDLVGPLNGQWMPAIAIGPGGVVHLTWMDYRDDPRGQSAMVYYAFSRDGGATWSPNARVSDAPFDGTGGYHQSGSGTIGDYMGLAASADAVVPFWADTRNGRNDVFAAIIPAR